MYLSDWIYAARIEDDVVLLDAHRGQYYCLASAASGFELDRTAPKIIDADLAEALDTMGLATKTPERIALQDCPAALRQLDVRVSGLNARQVIDAVAAYITIVFYYYRRSFSDIVARAIQTRPQAPGPIELEHLKRQIAAFRTWLPWAPFPGVCLFRSFMLLAFLRRAGLDASWVFGVRTWPFEAHCWLQHGDVVLDDTADNVRAFTPIYWV